MSSNWVLLFHEICLMVKIFYLLALVLALLLKSILLLIIQTLDLFMISYTSIPQHMHLFSLYFSIIEFAKLCESCSVVSDSLSPHGLYSPRNSPGRNTEVGSWSLLQGIFPIQWLNPGLPHCRWILYELSHQGSPRILEWVAYPFSSRSSQPRYQTGVSSIAGELFPTELPGKPL